MARIPTIPTNVIDISQRPYLVRGKGDVDELDALTEAAMSVGPNGGAIFIPPEFKIRIRGTWDLPKPNTVIFSHGSYPLVTSAKPSTYLDHVGESGPAIRPLAQGCRLENFGVRYAHDTTEPTAVIDDRMATKLIGMRVFNDCGLGDNPGSPAPLNNVTGLRAEGSAGMAIASYFSGFRYGVHLAGECNSYVLRDSRFQSNWYGAKLVSGASVQIVGNDFEAQWSGNLQLAGGVGVRASWNYYEQAKQYDFTPWSIMFGDPDDSTVGPVCVVWEGGYNQGGGVDTPVAIVHKVSGLEIRNVPFLAAQNQVILSNLYRNAAAGIMQHGNTAMPLPPFAWCDDPTGISTLESPPGWRSGLARSSSVPATAG